MNNLATELKINPKFKNLIPLEERKIMSKVDEVKEDKALLEKGIREVINEFEAKHDVYVSYIGLTEVTIRGIKKNGPVVLTVEV